ncbi:hypothetical protein [Nocardioides sp. CFH 31398]|uniref:hypothetical protein n=1 Tax=Nocardioides sp. CFH 31398 TaxID=2919579 RepID=UPI001F05745B|nr:hypothetical protein [Nocardioides sp. CFH 31398]MCH1869072.1 hypothetical protein [Nocardioides sp. CFH 31398]
MSQQAASSGPSVRAGDTLALSIHGPTGVLDLVVPDGATGVDVAREYARAAGLETLPHLWSAVGHALPADRALSSVGVEAGDLVVATTGDGEEARTPAPLVGRGAERVRPGRLSALWFALAGLLGLLAGWWAGQSGPGTTATAVAAVLGATALLGAAPVGQLSGQRAVAAPAFGAGAALAVVFSPGEERLPMVLGTAALAAAVVAAVARSWRDERDEALRVWMVAGSAAFVLAGTAAVLGARPAVVWSLLLLVAMLAARFVPSMAVDVPDQVLLDLDRLAVTAWSARDTRRGRRSSMIVTAEAMAGLVDRGSRLVTAAAAAVAVTAVVAAPMLLATATLELDRIGAWVQVFLTGAALLLAARSYRHRAAQTLLRVAGLACWASLTAVGLALMGDRVLLVGGVLVALAGGGCAVVAVATGRGWRSLWWSRRAEQSEAFAGALALAAVLVATGLFRFLWELTS